MPIRPSDGHVHICSEEPWLCGVYCDGHQGGIWIHADSSDESIFIQQDNHNHYDERTAQRFESDDGDVGAISHLVTSDDDIPIDMIRGFIRADDIRRVTGSTSFELPTKTNFHLPASLCAAEPTRTQPTQAVDGEGMSNHVSRMMRNLRNGIRKFVSKIPPKKNRYSQSQQPGATPADSASSQPIGSSQDLRSMYQNITYSEMRDPLTRIRAKLNKTDNMIHQMMEQEAIQGTKAHRSEYTQWHGGELPGDIYRTHSHNHGDHQIEKVMSADRIYEESIQSQVKQHICKTPEQKYIKLNSKIGDMLQAVDDLHRGAGQRIELGTDSLLESIP